MQNRRNQLYLTFDTRRGNWLERVLYAVVGVAVIVIGFFFITVAIVVGAVLALVIVARFWWLSRKLRRARNRNVMEGEYEVVERADQDQRPPRSS